MSVNEIMLYAGLAAAGASLLAGLISVFVFRIKRIKLEHTFDEEYGKKKK